MQMSSIQYNKTFLLQMQGDVQERYNALPVLQSKEAALRLKVRQVTARIKELDSERDKLRQSLSGLDRLWSEFPDVVRVEKIEFEQKKLASVNVMMIKNIVFGEEDFSLFSHPAWFLRGVEVVKEFIRLELAKINQEQILAAVDYARRKTTQKVNLYEKVQIPFFEEAIRKIKRYLEDVENLSKAGQKVIKTRISLQGA